MKENELFKYSFNRGKQTYAIEMKRKRHNLGTESCRTANDESGNWDGIVVNSTNSTESSCKRNLSYRLEMKKILLRNFYPHLYVATSLNSSDIQKITEVNKSDLYARSLGITQLIKYPSTD